MLALLALRLGGPFGEAEATAVSVDPFVVELVVEVNRPASAVVARPVGVGGELGALALSDFGDGRWGGILELSAVEDVEIVFELFEPDGGSFRSDPVTLRRLGVDRAIFDLDRPRVPAEARFDMGPVWLAVAIVAGVGALGLVAAWALRDEDA